MGFVTDAIGGLTGSGKKSAEKASDAQVRATELAIEEQRAAREQIRGDLSKFRALGEGQIPTAKDFLRLETRLADNQVRRANNINDFATNPRQQLAYLTDNPLFTSLTNEAQDRLFKNQAARGKVGSGGTAEALQNSLLLLGQDLINNSIAQRMQGFNAGQAGIDATNVPATANQNLITIGQNAAAGQASATQNAASSIADLNTQAGNAQAAGIIGARNAQTGALNNLINTGITAFALSDERVKENIERIGYTDSGIPVYRFTYIGDTTPHIGVMAQDVEKLDKDAVAERNGVKYVDYSRVH